MQTKQPQRSLRRRRSACDVKILAQKNILVERRLAYPKTLRYLPGMPPNVCAARPTVRRFFYIQHGLEYHAPD